MIKSFQLLVFFWTAISNYMYLVDDVNNRFDQSFWLNFLVNFFLTDSLSDKKVKIRRQTKVIKDDVGNDDVTDDEKGMNGT